MRNDPPRLAPPELGRWVVGGRARSSGARPRGDTLIGRTDEKDTDSQGGGEMPPHQNGTAVVSNSTPSDSEGDDGFEWLYVVLFLVAVVSLSLSRARAHSLTH